MHAFACYMPKRNRFIENDRKESAKALLRCEHLQVAMDLRAIP